MNNCTRGQAPARTNMQDVEAAGFGFVSEVASKLFLLYLDHLNQINKSTNLAAIKLNAMPGPNTTFGSRIHSFTKIRDTQTQRSTSIQMHKGQECTAQRSTNLFHAL
jgi:hypothetical protein